METPNITLTFGGVDFCLILICTSDGTDTFSVSKIYTSKIEIDLNNFVGTIRIKNHCNSNIASGDTASSLTPANSVNNPAVSSKKRAPDNDKDYMPPNNSSNNNITLE